MSTDSQIRFLAVAKVSAHVVVASYEHREVQGVNTHKLATKLVASGRLNNLVPPADMHLAVNKGGGLTVNAHVDTEDRCFIAITPDSYPRRHVAAADGPCIMNDLQEQFVRDFGEAFSSCSEEDGLSRRCKAMLRGVATKYSDLSSIDKIRKVEAQVEGVRTTMAANIDKALQRGERLDVIDGKTDELQLSSVMFEARATRVQRIMKLRYYKLVCVVVTLVLVVILYICLPLLTSSGD